MTRNLRELEALVAGHLEQKNESLKTNSKPI